MGREIKFRAWDGEQLLQIQTISCWEDGAHFCHDGDKCTMFDYKTSAIMQYTGLKDKNGLEIYEGDIVKCHGQHYEVEWEPEEGGFVASRDGAAAMLGSEWAEIGGIEVIGNIHQHPELLNTGNGEINV